MVWTVVVTVIVRETMFTWIDVQRALIASSDHGITELFHLGQREVAIVGAVQDEHRWNIRMDMIDRVERGVKSAGDEGRFEQCRRKEHERIWSRAQREIVVQAIPVPATCVIQLKLADG